LHKTGLLISIGRYPYQNVANNPISNVDINGDSIWVNIEGQDYYFAKNGDIGYGFFSGKDGSLYSGSDEFACELTNGLTELMELTTKKYRQEWGR
jgi:hypothetical protein